MVLGVQAACGLFARPQDNSALSAAVRDAGQQRWHVVPAVAPEVT